MSSQHRHLDVEADLTVSHEHGDFTVSGAGNRIVIDLPGLGRGWKLARSGSEQVGRDGLQACDRVLRGTGLGVEVRMNERCVARLGEGSRPRLGDRLLNLSPWQVNGWALVRSLVWS